jgi:hypothetical protein
MLVTDPTHPFADFRNFVYAVWKFLNLPDPTPVQYDIAHYLQHGPKRCGIEAFRGVGKSYLTSAFAVWCLYWDQDYRIMVVSASKERADAFSQFCLRLIFEMPELKHLIPGPEQKRSLIAFEVKGARVDHSPSVKSVGINGQLTGSRADLIIADDVETPRNSLTIVQREKLEVLVTEFDAVLKPLPHARVVYLGTPQCEDSLYNKLAKKGYEFRIWPARKPTPDQVIRYAGKLAPYIESLQVPLGSTTDPRRFSNEDLKEREASYGRSGFALQFMLDTSLSDGLRYPLRCSDIIVMDVDRELAPVKVSYGSSADQLLNIECVGLTGDRWYQPMYVSKDFTNYTGSVMFIDPSGRGKDKTSYVVLKNLSGVLYLTRAGNLDGGYEALTLMALARVASAEKVHTVLIESNFGDGMFTQLFKPVLQKVHLCTVEDVRHSKQKELRIIDTLEPILNQHRLVVDKAIVQADMQGEVEHQLFYQLTRVTRDKGALAHDDLLDALAGAAAHFLQDIDLDTGDAERRFLEDKMDEEIARFMAQVDVSWGPSQPNWCDQI